LLQKTDNLYKPALVIFIHSRYSNTMLFTRSGMDKCEIINPIITKNNADVPNFVGVFFGSGKQYNVARFGIFQSYLFANIYKLA